HLAGPQNDNKKQIATPRSVDTNVARNDILGGKLWKPFIESLKLETKDVLLTDEGLEKIPGWEYLKPLLKNFTGSIEIIVNTEVLNNLAAFLKLIDWERGGYLEVVDLIVPTVEGFLKDRRPKKYDGALAVPINGPLLKEFLLKNQKHLSLTPIRGINSICRVVSHDFQTLLTHQHFVTMAEIAPKREQKPAEIIGHAQKLFSFGADMVTFSDQAHAGLEYYAIDEIAKQEIFSQLPGGAILPILAVRRKTIPEIKSFCAALLKQKVNNLFVLIGDPAPGETILRLSWENILPLVSSQFFTGAVAHPNPNDLENSLQKVALGARFLIVQACYDRVLWQKWQSVVKAKKLYEKVKLIPVIIPIITKKSLGVLRLLPDVAVSEDFHKDFKNLNDSDIRQKGIALAKSMIAEYKNEGIFAGVYLYSKSSEVVKEILYDS
ncbi:methylenetetrahydrofolate reductase, partial [Candidatus Gottesmanbacteria bacterium]|nr:methylenetetrahydrofolate reductase [Candidatus Gottesmanbacteria bacterium]